MRARVILIVAAVVLLGFAPAPLPRRDRHREAEADVTGTWEFALWEFAGQRSQKHEERFVAELTKDSFVIVRKGGDGGQRFTMRREPKASPPAFTWEQNGETVIVGSYRLDGGQLTMIFTRGSHLADRPTDFGGEASYRYVLRRVAR